VRAITGRLRVHDIGASPMRRSVRPPGPAAVRADCRGGDVGAGGAGPEVGGGGRDGGRDGGRVAVVRHTRTMEMQQLVVSERCLSTPRDCLVTALCKPRDCLVTASRLPRDCLVTASRPCWSARRPFLVDGYSGASGHGRPSPQVSQGIAVAGYLD
jgi:hypothetical protein